MATIERPELDVTTLTLGEMAAAERASGQSFDELLRGRASRWLLALYIIELRRSPSSGSMRSWSELADLRPLAAPSSPSPTRPDGVPETSPS